MASVSKSTQEQRQQDIAQYEKRLRRLRSKHILLSSIVLVICVSIIIALYPTPLVSFICALCVCIFFCIGVSYQRAVMQTMILALAIILIMFLFYFIFS